MGVHISKYRCVLAGPSDQMAPLQTVFLRIVRLNSITCPFAASKTVLPSLDLDSIVLDLILPYSKFTYWYHRLLYCSLNSKLSVFLDWPNSTAVLHGPYLWAISHGPYRIEHIICNIYHICHMDHIKLVFSSLTHLPKIETGFGDSKSENKIQRGVVNCSS